MCGYSSTFTVIMLIHIVFLFRETYRVVGFEVETMSIDYSQLTFSHDDICSFPDQPKHQLVNEQSGTRLFFTYSVEWSKSKVSWASRWDIYLGMSDVQIHWFSIINSLVVVFFLSGKNGPYNGIWSLSVCLSVCTLVLEWFKTFFFLFYLCVRYDSFLAGILAMIMVRTLRRDIARYNADEGPDEAIEETGWKLVHGDVFRPPRYSRLFAAVIGSGIQIFFMALITICMYQSSIKG